MNRVLKAIGNTVAFLAFFVGAVMAGRDAEAKGKAIGNMEISIVGKTADGKYPVYDLDGGINDVSWFSGNYVFKGNDLLTRLVFVKKADVESGVYKCDWVCADKQGRIIGQPYYNQKFLNGQ